MMNFDGGEMTEDENTVVEAPTEEVTEEGTDSAEEVSAE